MNLFEEIPDHLTEELVEIIFSRPHCRVERIISRGQTTPENIWYDQPEEEWIVLLQGEAALSIERDRVGTGAGNTVGNAKGKTEEKTVGSDAENRRGEADPAVTGDGEGFEEVNLKKGDSLLIKIHQKHRVTHTSEDPACIWLCFFTEPI